MITRALILWSLWLVAGAAEESVIRTERADGRHIGSRGVAQALLEHMQPTCAFSPDMEAKDFPAWQERLRQAMREVMKHPTVTETPAPKRLMTAKREGYRIEKWEAYPLPDAAVPYLVLVPEGVGPATPAPAILCLPGSGQSKEQLAGERAQDLSAPPVAPTHHSAMALHYVREGYIAIAVDNAGTGETGDKQDATRYYNDDENLARILLELNWSWLGYTTFADQCILNWMKQQPMIRRERIILSGFSLGTEPMMALGVLNPDIYAFVYNDFLCRTLERLQVLTKPNGKGARPAPNSIRHLIPGFLQAFDFPDIVAALAPRPVICTEGGLDRDFRLIQTAYALAGAPGNFTFCHQPKYADPAQRWQGDKLPPGMDRDTFFRYANVDPGNHYFKEELVLPWLRSLLRSHNTAPTAHPQ